MFVNDIWHIDRRVALDFKLVKNGNVFFLQLIVHYFVTIVSNVANGNLGARHSNVSTICVDGTRN